MQKFTKYSYVVVCSIGFILLSISKGFAEDGGKVRFRIKVRNAFEAQSIIPDGIDIAGQNIHKHTIDMVASREYFDSLKQRGVPVQLIEAQPEQVDDHYLTPEKIYGIIKALAEQYPDIVYVEKIGESVQGRPIYAVRLSSKQNALYKPAVLFNGMHHAREIMTTEVTTDIMTYLAKNYDNPDTPWVATWLDNLAIWVVPQLNPDGNAIVWTSDNWWRKNARGDGSQVWGVDLNRNYPFQWNTCEGSSGARDSETYRGEAPGSEPETKALMHLVEDQNFVADISYHSYSELVISPYGCQNQFSPEDFILKNIGAEFASKLKKDDGNSSYDYGTAWQLLYPVDGEDISWMYHEYNTMAYVVEMNSEDQGFQPDYATWRDKTVTAQRAGWQTLLHRILTGPQVRGRMVDAKTGEPVDGNVIVNGVKYTTEKPRHGKNGVYTKMLAPGSYELIFAAPGYETQTIPVSIDEGAGVNLDVFFEAVHL